MSAVGDSTSGMIGTDAVVLQIVKEMAPSGLTDVAPEVALVADLGFDSFGLVELLVVLEDALKLQPIDIEASGKLDRVADLQRVVQEALAQTVVRRSQ